MPRKAERIIKLKDKRKLRWAGWAAAALFGALLLWRSGLLEAVGSAEELRAMIGRYGVLGGAVFFAAQMLTVIFAPIPSNVTMLAGAAALGFFEAMVLGVAAVIAGSMLMFLAARKLGRKAVRRFLERGVMEKYLPLIEEKQETFLFLAMLFPFFPDDVLCILAGLTDMPFARFAAIIALARPWGLVFAALVGGGEIPMPAWGWAIVVPVMAAAFCLAMKYSARIERALLGLIHKLTHRSGEDAA